VSGKVGVYAGRGMAAYGFTRGSAPGGKHYYGPDRFDAFFDRLRELGLAERVQLLDAPPADDDELLLFHRPEYLERVRRLCAADEGALDHGPTPAERGMDTAAAHVVGAVLDGARRLVDGRNRRLFVPVSGFHHGRPDRTADYCIFNDCAVLLRYLLERVRLARVAYVDIDVHLGDGVYEAFLDDPRVAIADLHQDAGTFWYASPGDAEVPLPPRPEKLSVAFPAGAGDAEFLAAWERVEDLVAGFHPELIVFVAGADAMAGDRLGGLAFGPAVYAGAATRLCALAERSSEGRLLVLGGGGYHLANLAEAWTAVVAALLDAPPGEVPIPPPPPDLRKLIDP
jgi:acetoin utilization protein AcuC